MGCRGLNIRDFFILRKSQGGLGNRLLSETVSGVAYYAKTDAAGKATTYTYNTANRLSSRTWARNVAQASPLVTSYSYSSATGELTSVDYSDSTPDIAYTYNRIGQQKTVEDAAGTRIFTYNAALQPISEAITGMYDKTINRTYATSGVAGRYTGINIGTEYDVSYSYDTLGRLSNVTNDPNGTNDTFSYAYLANSNLVASIAYPHNISVTNTYEANRDLITQIKNYVSFVPSVAISQYDYTNDALGRCTSMSKSGTAFSAADTISYTYNDRSEVTSADAVTDANYNFGFDYDSIGNRKTYDTTESGSNVQSVYTTNNLNQYTSITNPAQSPTYDDDGNMLTMTLASGSWTNTFNAENRIIAQEKSDAKLEYVYDYMGRRVEKKVYSGSVGNWVLDEHWKFVYDGYEQIEKLDGLNSDGVARKRIWGNGKIIADIHSSTVYYALGDANKNITEYLDSSGVIQGHYEYSPFGKITVASGDMADDFEYRFSSEVFDQETGLSYYNYRYYSPELGRWLSRDPIMEEGGENLYGMVGNDPVGWWDLIGLASKELNQIGAKAATAAAEALKKFMEEFKRGVDVIVVNLPEFCGRICCKDEQYTITGPAMGPWKKTIGAPEWVQGRRRIFVYYGLEPASCTPNLMPETKCPSGWIEVGQYHNHPSGSPEFSDGDIGYTRYMGKPFYVIGGEEIRVLDPTARDEKNRVTELTESRVDAKTGEQETVKKYPFRYETPKTEGGRYKIGRDGKWQDIGP